jgi:hypothetical protein
VATLRCPQCGTLNRDDAVDFPLCRNCHERLVQCGYCRQFERTDAEGAGICREKDAGGPRATTADAAPDCRYFQARYRVRSAAASRVPIHPAAWILGGFALVLIGFFAWSAVVRPSGSASPRRASVQLDAEVPYPVRPGSEFTIDLIARNLAARPTGDVLIGIDSDFLAKFPLQSLDPLPTTRRAGRGRVWFLYPSLRRGEWLRVKLRVAAPPSGDYTLRAHLAGPGLESVREIQVPIRVTRK